jgi:hypothetical protein
MHFYVIMPVFASYTKTPWYEQTIPIADPHSLPGELGKYATGRQRPALCSLSKDSRGLYWDERHRDHPLYV